MEFHISRALRRKYDVDDLLFNYVGNVIFGSLAACRRLAKNINDAHAREGSAEVVHAGALFAMGLIDELSHAMVEQYRATLDPAVLPDALRWLEQQDKTPQVEKLLLAFTEQFPNVAIYRGDNTAATWLNETAEGMSNREAALEELILLWLANSNPAFTSFRELFDDRELKQKTIYKQATAGFADYFATRPEFAPNAGSLLDVLRAPMLASPGSLGGQLAYIREHWTEHLGEELSRALLAIDVLKEEDIAIWMRFHPSSAAHHHEHSHQQGGWGAEGFEGDQFVGFDTAVASRSGQQQQQQQQPPLNEYEAFSPDQAWMPTVVLIAKSTYVWLEQLSKKYLRHIQRLDQIPDEELALLAGRGMNGLWLIGLWERSRASQTIKRLRGQADAVASAYSLKDYRIAEDLGGTAAYEHLRDRAAAFGIRLASDMVPNHMGIDSTWVMEHPEWFLSRSDSPFPVYSFEGPDLSDDSRYEIKIEDHYYEQTDAAVVFRLRDRRDSRAEYVYHGNDGTTFAWNDTAQLNYSRHDVREHVIQTILGVAKLFPIIRFDAAMTLARRHVQRLWFPLPGAGGSIPSRAEFAMTQAEFDALMPNEFWREVVDRVAAEVPGTLLLAEAFWLLEGYFVRTLGMHRVYNSAFMNMLRDEENVKYRSYLKKTIEFDPDILKRYVNFMSNPDERTAIDQFGTGDKYFGTCTLLATLPGLPMFGHGQVEAFTEKYGMEYKQARLDESPNQDLVARHLREIAPLLKNRKLFAESNNFVLYDFWIEAGTVDENVFAYSNRSGQERVLVIFNNRYGGTRGTVHLSAASMDKVSGSLRQLYLAEALQLKPEGEASILAYKDTVTGLEYLRRAIDLDHHGFMLDLRGYQYAVLQGWRALLSTAEQPWAQLCDALNGAGVHNLDEALSKLQLRPLHETLRQVLSQSMIRAVIDVANSQPVSPQLEAEAETHVLVEEPEEDTKPAEREDEQEAGPIEPASTVELHDETTERDDIEPQLATLAQRADAFFLKVMELEESSESASWKREEETAISPVPEDSLPIKFSAALPAVVSLPQVEQKLLDVWPVDARTLPLNGALENNPNAVWAPILTLALLNTLASEIRDGAMLFDQLQLRSALADIYSSLGIEDENAWRAAGRIRIALAWANTPTATAMQSEIFWSDPDIRWLAGVNNFNGSDFVNKESFDELLWWLELSSLLTREPEKLALPEMLDESRQRLACVLATMQASSYNVKDFVAQMCPEEPAIQMPPDKVEVMDSKESIAPVTSETPMDSSIETTDASSHASVK
jgi:hypothetical protein